MIPLTLALGASVAWGASDFLGGLASRRLPVVVVLLGAQACGLALAATVWAPAGRHAPDPAAVAGSALTAATPGGRRVVQGASLGLGAALCFGAFFVLLSRASELDAPVAVLSGRVASVGVLAVLLAGRLTVGARPGRPDVGVIAMLGGLDVAANLAYAVATGRGADATVAVLASLYPLTTVLLARALLHERLGAARLAGVAAVLGGIALISASS
jgi:drug/metabolite transporter (DMT)-like permease